MRLYDPKVQVRLVKAVKRKEIVPDVPIAQRYASLESIDLTPYLSEHGGVQTTKGVREPAGGFSISLADKEHRDAKNLPLDSLYALIEPMDLIEIRMAHDLFDYAKRGEGYRPPVVMRGLVSSVTRAEAMSGDRPSRSVTISGQDFGKVLQIIQIFYLNNSVVGDNILSELAFFHKYGEAGGAKIKSAVEFVNDVLNGVINPYLKRFTALANGEKVGAKVINSWTPNVSIEGAISPWSVSQFNNTSLYQMLASLLDVGAFNELFVEDLEDGVTLTVRPAPFLDAELNPIQGVRPEVITIPSKDIVAMNVTRTDMGVANYFWVMNGRWTMMGNEDAARAASSGKADDYIKFEYLNSAAATYGVRKMEVGASLGPEDYLNADSQTKEQLPVENAKMLGWLERRRKVLADINKDNVLFESGSLRLRGNERIKAGMQLNVIRGAGVQSSFYVTHVTHEFAPLQGFFTTVQVERGTSFIGRSQADVPLYRNEIDGWGVS